MRLSGYRCSLPGLAGFAGPHRTGLEPRKRIVAERVGFEPTLEFPLNTLSKRAPSATRSSLRAASGATREGDPPRSFPDELCARQAATGRPNADRLKKMAERVGFEPTWRFDPPRRFR